VVAFRITKEIHAPPEYVVRWWLDYTSEDSQLSSGVVHRTVERLDENRVHLSTTTEFGGRLRTTDGTVTRTGPTNWHMTGHVISDGVVVSTLQTTYSVAPLPDGSRLDADFEFLGRTFAWKLALSVSGFALRRRQSKTFNDYVQAIETDFAASRSRPPTGVTPGPTSPSSGAPR
jgi:hypothetical protein